MKKIILLAIFIFSFILTKANSTFIIHLKINFTYNTCKNYDQQKTASSLVMYPVQVTYTAS